MRTNFGVAAFTILLVVLCLPSGTSRLDAQAPSRQGEKLQFVAVLSRHGVRTPTNTPEDLQAYAPEPWPLWNAPAAELTTRGEKLMQLLGSYYRDYLTRAGLLAPTGCADRDKIYFWADAVGRDVESAWLIGRSMMPACNITVHRVASGPDPLFSPRAAGIGKFDVSAASAEFLKMAGNSPEAVLKNFGTEVQMVEQILFGCRPSASCPAVGSNVSKRILELPALVQPKDNVASAPAVATAFAIAQAILLQHQDGKDDKDIAWGRFNATTQAALEAFDTKYWSLLVTPYASKARSSNLLSHILRAVTQAAQGAAVPGALGRPGDKALFVLGHDTDMKDIAAMLGLSWQLEPRGPNETLPGSALIFELWRDEARGTQSVRTYFQSQTVEQMRRATPLSLRTPPVRVRLSPGGCGTDESCEWTRFKSAVEAAIDPAFVSNQ
jgi:4-phytase/acid phosphatase